MRGYASFLRRSSAAASRGPTLRGPSGRPSTVATDCTPIQLLVRKISSARQHVFPAQAALPDWTALHHPIADDSRARAGGAGRRVKLIAQNEEDIRHAGGDEFGAVIEK